MNLIWKIANYLAKPYLFISGSPIKKPRTSFAMMRLYLAIQLFQYHYNKEKKNGALLLIAKCYQSMEKLDDSFKYLKLAWETDPFNSVLFKEIGTCCLNLQKFDEGLRYALKEVSQFPSNPEAKANLAYFLYKNNRLGEAKKVIDEAIQLDNSNQYVNNIFKILENV